MNMDSFFSRLLVAASVFAVCGFTPPPASQTGPAEQADSANSGDQARVDLLDAEVAGQRGDWHKSVRLAERSYTNKPDVWNEFNLATAYQNMHQGQLAVPLYLDLVDRGKFAQTHAIFSNDNTWPKPILPFISDEAALRLHHMGVPIEPERDVSLAVFR